MQIPERIKRKQIVYRVSGTTSVVQASAIGSPEELAYAISWLAHHRLYKMSKSGGVTMEKAQAVANAFMDAAETFQADVLDQLGGAKPKDRISALGDGEVENPYGFL